MNKLKLDKKRRIQELKRFNEKLKSTLNLNRTFKRIYESSNNKKDDDDELEYIVVGDKGNKNIFSGISRDTVDFLNTKGKFNHNIFDVEDRIIEIKNYYDLLKTVKYLIQILEFDMICSFAGVDALSEYVDIGVD
jgi:hypothetical protein